MLRDYTTIVWYADLKKMNKIYANVNLLLRKFSSCFVNVKFNLLWTYCSTSYCSCTYVVGLHQNSFEKIESCNNNSLHRFMTLPWSKSASEIFVNLNTFCLMKCLEILYLDLCQDFLFQIMYLTVYRLGERS